MSERVHAAALRLLERRRRTRRELEDKLTAQGHAPEAIRPVLDRLAAVGLVDDVGYARAFLRSRLERRTSAPALLRLELIRRGVPSTAIATALAELDAGPEADAARAEKALAQLLRRTRGLAPEVAERRCLNGMIRRGFRASLARDLVRRAFVRA